MFLSTDVPSIAVFFFLLNVNDTAQLAAERKLDRVICAELLDETHEPLELQ
jgi:hypothetical protein